ncbi:MAG: hypothetical protein RLZ72_348 [Actinomycetota bacterium]
MALAYAVSEPRNHNAEGGDEERPGRREGQTVDKTFFALNRELDHKRRHDRRPQSDRNRARPQGVTLRDRPDASHQRNHPGRESGGEPAGHKPTLNALHLKLAWREAIMARLLVLSASSEPPIPALTLLPHQIVTAPLSPQSVANHGDVNVIIIDGVTDLVSAKSMASVLATAQVPVPVLLALRDTSLPVIDASWGITDFLMPTTTLAEVDARIRLAITTHQPTGATGISHSGVSIDEASYQANVGGRALDLTFKEFELLRYLVANPSRVFTREQLLSEVWGYDYFGGTRTVDVHVRRLRAKLGDHESVIGTVRNVGYRFAPNGEDE